MRNIQIKTVEDSVAVTKALADSSRLRVIAALMQEGEMCVCHITDMLGLAVSTVSRHMKVLLNAGLVSHRKSGRWVYYAVSEQFPLLLMQWIKDKVCSTREVKDDSRKLQKIRPCGP